VTLVKMKTMTTLYPEFESPEIEEVVYEIAEEEV
jgi:hypothetical protein